MKIWALIDEMKVVEELLNDGKTINVDTKTKLICYIKFLKQKGLSKDEIRNSVDKVMLDNYVGFCMGDWDKDLQKLVNKYSKSKNCQFKEVNNEVVIYKKELDMITSVGVLDCVPSIESEKVLFVMLVLAKISKGEWVNYTSKDIFKLAKYKYKIRSDIQKVQRDNLIYDLSHCTKENLLAVTNFGLSPSLKLLFVENEGEEVLRFKVTNENIEKVILNYLIWRNKEGYNYCKECGVGMVKANNKQLYCNKCKKEKDLEKYKRYNEKRK